MLTDAEKEWLEDRDTIQFATGNFLHASYLKNERDDYRDAAEFEARVAEKLAKSICVVCPENKNGRCPTRNKHPQRADIEACRMRHARLAAEEEMGA